MLLKCKCKPSRTKAPALFSEITASSDPLLGWILFS